ncbi:MAG: monovalent cation/H+ antiporter complex subunit F [Desulfurococcaceae archaeon]
MNIFDLLLAVIGIYMVSILILLIRALKGPSISDQVLAIDVMTYAIIVIILLFAIYLREPILAVVPIPLALWVYSLDIYVAKYLEKRDLGA